MTAVKGSVPFTAFHHSSRIGAARRFDSCYDAARGHFRAPRNAIVDVTRESV
jgi:hypothetical protein